MAITIGKITISDNGRITIKGMILISVLLPLLSCQEPTPEVILPIYTDEPVKKVESRYYFLPASVKNEPDPKRSITDIDLSHLHDEKLFIVNGTERFLDVEICTIDYPDGWIWFSESITRLQSGDTLRLIIGLGKTQNNYGCKVANDKGSVSRFIGDIKIVLKEDYYRK